MSNSTCENNVFLLMITHSEKWHYLAVFSLLRGITLRIMVVIIVLSVFIQLEQKISSKHMKMFAEAMNIII